LEYLDEDSLRLSDKGKLSRSDIKSIARSTLQALSSLHAKGIAHTGT
jgi:serine/threonine protein kinase